ncbi:PIR protein, putative [Plasmodium sp.]|nr:PIR protein, putative [Plasmodium sp.]
MKVHYINILLFSLPLNILVSSKRNPYITHNTPNTKPIRAHRTLCECELYSLSNYDNDPEMKEVMQQFDRQSSQRFLEYDEHMQEKRRKCKEQCDKDIQKIILKDRIEKELTEKLSTLETNIGTNDIPTCVCEKSIADKMEKTCLRCGQNLGGMVPGLGLIGGAALYSINAWKAAALVAAKEAAEKAGIAAGEAARIKTGIDAVISGLRTTLPIENLGFGPFKYLIHGKTYTDAKLISDAINLHYTTKCITLRNVPGINTSMCDILEKVGFVGGEGLGNNIGTPESIKIAVQVIVSDAERAAALKAGEVTASKTAAVEAAKKGAIDATYVTFHTAVSASIVAILIIVLIMVIIYLILRYRRKKEMKKKLQYIKLLKE